MCFWELWGPQPLDRSNLEDGLAVNWLLIIFSWKNNFIQMKEGMNAGMQRANERRKEYFLLKNFWISMDEDAEMEFLDINLLHAIHSLFYWRIL